ncbi:putative stress-induced transcription regulator [Streptomyces sp. 846.5]|nr:CGNR zinc finger domain-containing protein [Streptomyces sp. 846.5]TDT97261.1 putative stress-induced transcription regulator [Streptomyces sp. 846.5]
MLENTATSRYEANPAPDDLALVQELANTIGVGPGADLLASADSAARWLASIGARPASGVDAASLERLRRLRTALRGMLGDHPEGPGQSVDLTLRLRLDDDGIAVLRDGPDLVDAGVTVALLEGRATGALSRLKLCANPDCRVAFFDQSKNGAGKWHSPTRCGNTARVRAHRNRTSSRPDVDGNSSS